MAIDHVSSAPIWHTGDEDRPLEPRRVRNDTLNVCRRARIVAHSEDIHELRKRGRALQGTDQM